jgi:hypothetical protein
MSPQEHALAFIKARQRRMARAVRLNLASLSCHPEGKGKPRKNSEIFHGSQKNQ